ncbi:helix-turn-helix domain-containing protein [Clostridium tertium]|uniref:helix-turn-helix domain-containing protein n=1 Tax=Clostridium tertium TaxID=1559 RepID=UPI00189FBB63|nr:helix-turn-helix domain-containing protein [Clostridium tertium]MDB1949082.1 helix-turn-helix domain-containing protein [Clostridium tertium]MDB1955480.1 helix-turn-helix domain-containing protein [Clostridium tertium]MDB1957576.1 helix-turn-helix domain-containing protein [Clostridium tertium]MDB1962680.1 helix-turn-helix domain-containing protein [Clostridium tertium]MDB1966725.1 helix-turn-helix domain-containing protein [Clostridium tertium]
MSIKSKVSTEIKVQAVEDYLKGIKSLSEISNELNIYKSAISAWVRKYKTFGKEGLLNKGYNTSYSAQLKTQAVIDYLDGKGSLDDICIKYKISDIGILQQWIKKYNGHKIFKSHSTKGDKLMTNGGKTTYEERIEIVSFCIANAHDYNLTANKFNVSYQQVYTWVKKYNKDGYNVLVDRRGKNKSFEELSESEKFSAQLKLLEAENRRLKMENDFLKKLEEIERS